MAPQDYLTSLFGLQGQRALCTGATRGIGQEIAKALASAGATIVLAQRDLSNQDTLKEIEALGGQVEQIECDLEKPDSVKSLVKRATQNGRIDILLNCGGIQRRNPPEDYLDEDWDALLQVNLTAAFILTRDVGKHMLESKRTTRGKIINIASIMTFQAGVNVPAYAATKHAMLGFTKSCSNTWSSKGINVNCICPGYVATDFNPELRGQDPISQQILSRIPYGAWAKPFDMAGAAVYLASPASDYVCGQALVVDGGWLGR